VWYNTAGYALKYSGEGAGAWASSPAVNTGRENAAGAGTTTAAIYVGGNISTPVQDLTEIFDGTSWTEVNDLLTARRLYTMGVGTTTAALGAGGYYPGANVAIVEEYDGTSWTEVTDLGTAQAGQK